MSFATSDAASKLEDQEVVLTVPASFDEAARELTVESARRAGFKNLTLLEEPQAAFYCWIVTHHDAWQGQVRAGELILVCDVGGGSTQLLAGTADGPAWMRPLDLGSLRLTARCLHSNPPTKGELELARNEVAECFAPVTPPLVRTLLATGGSAIAVLRRLREAGATDLRLVCLVAAPEGVRAVREAEPNVPILAGTLDRQLDERGYIRPGLGDAGDRIFGTE